MRRRNVILIALPLLAILAMEICQLLLPGMAEQRIKDRLAGRAQVQAVSVSAFPAVKLLWGEADSVTIRLAELSASRSQIPADLSQTAGVDRMRVEVGVLHTGLLTLRNATLIKSGERMSGSAVVLSGDLRAAVPPLQSVTASAVPGGSLRLSGSVSLLGAAVSGSALVSLREGAIELTPELPFGGLATLTVFSDPRLAVQTLSARAVSGGFALSAEGTLR